MHFSDCESRVSASWLIVVIGRKAKGSYHIDRPVDLHALVIIRDESAITAPGRTERCRSAEATGPRYNAREFPRLGGIGDAREVPAQLERSHQFAVLLNAQEAWDRCASGGKRTCATLSER